MDPTEELNDGLLNSTPQKIEALGNAVFVVYAHWAYGISNPLLCPKSVPKDLRKVAKMQMFFAPTVYLIAILLSYVNPKISIGIYFLTPVFYFLPNKLDKYLP